ERVRHPNLFRRRAGVLRTVGVHGHLVEADQPGMLVLEPHHLGADLRTLGRRAQATTGAGRQVGRHTLDLAALRRPTKRLSGPVRRSWRRLMVLGDGSVERVDMASWRRFAAVLLLVLGSVAVAAPAHAETGSRGVVSIARARTLPLGTTV